MSKTRGWLDFLLTVLTCSAVYLQSPLGGLIDRGLDFTFGGDSHSKPLTSFFAFDAGGGDGPSTEDLQRLAQASRSEIAPTGPLSTLPRHLYSALSLAAKSDGILLSQQQIENARVLAEQQSIHVPDSRGPQSTLLAALLIADHARLLGSLDAGLSALRVGTRSVQRAINLAQSRGRPQPKNFASYKPYLSRSERMRAKIFVNQVMAMVIAFDFEWPVRRSHRISSGFGYRNHPILAQRKFHNGVDLAVPVGTSVFAPQSGVVRYSTYDNINGNYTKLDHGYGLSTSFCHNQEIKVDSSDLVDQGQIIAKSGNSGRSTGPHLHYIIKIGRSAIDPILFK